MWIDNFIVRSKKLIISHLNISLEKLKNYLHITIFLQNQYYFIKLPKAASEENDLKAEAEVNSSSSQTMEVKETSSKKRLRQRKVVVIEKEGNLIISDIVLCCVLGKIIYLHIILT